MPDLPASTADARLDADLDDDLDDGEALELGGLPSTGSYVANQIAREHEDQETLDVLEGLRKLATGDPVRWQIWRIDGADPYKNGFLANWSTTMLTQERMRDEFGPGTYRIEGTRSNGKYLRRRTITIAEDAPRGSREPKQSMNAVTSHSGFDVQAFLAQQEARDTQRRREEDERRQREEEKEEKRRAERQQLILALGPAALAAVAQMFGNRTDPLAIAAALRPTPGPDPLAMIAALKQLAPEAPKGPSPTEQALTLFELLADKAGQNGARTDWLDVVKEGVKIMGPSVGGAIEATITQARANAQAQQTGSVSQNPGAMPLQGAPPPALLSPESSATPVHSNGSDPAMMDLLDLAPHVTWLREQLTKMSSAAARNRDPELYAAMFLEELPPGLTAQRVLELLMRSDWLHLLARFNPQIAHQQAWWVKTRDRIVAYIHEAAAPARPATTEIDRPTALPSLTGD